MNVFRSKQKCFCSKLYLIHTVTCQKFKYIFIFHSSTTPSVVWYSIERFEVSHDLNAHAWLPFKTTLCFITAILSELNKEPLE